MIHIIVGLMNSGKTLYMTKLLYRDYLRGRKILTNYPVNFPHYLINVDWLLNLAKDEDTVIENISMGLDELWIHFDSRSSMSEQSKLGSYFFLQSSKDDSNIYITAQDNRQNEYRIRQNLHKITMCSRVFKAKEGQFQALSDERRFLPLAIQKRLYIKAMTFKRVLMGFNSGLSPARTEYVKASKYFPLYDTRKKIYTQSK